MINKQKFLPILLTISAACFAGSICAKGGDKPPPPPPVDTLPSNLQAELKITGHQLLGGIALSGNTMTSICSYNTATGVQMWAICMLERVGTTWSFKGKLNPVDYSKFYLSGPSVDGNTLIIPVTKQYIPVPETTFSDNYKVMVKNASGVWVQQAQILPPSGVIFNNHAFNGNTLVAIGTSATDVTGTAYVYNRTYSATGVAVWSLQAKLKPLNAANAYLKSVSISGDTLALGSNMAKVAFVYKRTGTTWAQQAKLVPADTGVTSNYFGDKVAISGDNLIVGAGGAILPNPNETTYLIGQTLVGYASQAGAAYIFRRTTGVWKQVVKLIQDAPGFAEPQALFGAQVDANGDAVMVSAYSMHDRPAAVYVYQRNATTGAWPMVSSVDPEDGYPFLDMRYLPGTIIFPTIALNSNTYVAGGQHSTDYYDQRRIFVMTK